MLGRALSKTSEQRIPSGTIEPIEPISKEQIQKSIGAIKDHKGPRSDTISAEVFKASGEEMNNFFKKCLTRAGKKKVHNLNGQKRF